MVKVLYTLLYLLSKVGLKVPIKPKLSTYGTLLCAYPAEYGFCLVRYFSASSWWRTSSENYCAFLAFI